MTIMPDHSSHVIGGVDTHGDAHHAAVIDPLGRHLADREFPATRAGYRSLESWLRSHGTVAAIGIEGTGAYGAELARTLTRSGLKVIEVDRPDRKTRRLRGKSDPIDAYERGRAMHRVLDQVTHLHAGAGGHGRFAFAEAYRREGKFHLDALLP